MRTIPSVTFLWRSGYVTRNCETTDWLNASQSSTPAATLAPWRTKYTPEAARNYQIHTDRKDHAEKQLVIRAFGHIPRGSVLDVPCGGGRMSLMLARQGYSVTAADLSETMLRITRENARAAELTIKVLRQDIEQMDFRHGSFDTVFAFRLFHHFPNREIRARVVAQLCRVARERVLISYFSPWAGTSLKRALQSKWLGHRQKKFATSRDELESYFSPQGFTLRRTFARCPLIHTLHLALFERK